MKFSIVIPTFNRSSFIGQTITDVINQTYTHWELIIIDDGSTDDTKEVVAQFINNPQIQYIYQENAERSEARNNGIKNSEGDFVCFVDSDERLNPSFLKLISRAIKRNLGKDGVYYYDIGFVLEKDHSNIIYKREGIRIVQEEGIDQLMNVVIGVPQLCISRSILKLINFNPKINVGEDLELLVRLYNHCMFYYLPGEPQIFEIEHSNRSVELKDISNLRNIETLKYIFRKPHPGNGVSRKIKKIKLSDAYLRGVYFYSLNKERSRAITLLLKSIYLNPRKQLKHKLNLIFYLCFKPKKIERLINA
jgi:glycosyltransferase involved in cell wall biosynthesis